MQFFDYIIFLILIINQELLVKCSYCDLSQVPVCQNKTHLLCEPRDQVDTMNGTIIENILRHLNKNRSNLKRFQFICNLDNFNWNTELEKMAPEIFYKSDNYCNITTNFKNILEAFRTTIDITDSNSIATRIDRFLPYIIKVPESAYWIASPYSTDIGCSIVQPESSEVVFICLVNGIMYKPAEQGEYKQNCNNDNQQFVSGICSKEDAPCTNHFICERHNLNFVNLKLSPIQITTRHYIVYKFEQENQTVAWNYDLQYLAARLVGQNLTSNDECLAREKFGEVSALHFNGTKYFDEQFSNIDSIWERHNVSGQIGCVMFNTMLNERACVHLYCLTGTKIIPVTHIHYSGFHRMKVFVNEIFVYIKFDSSDHWLIYLLLVLTTLDIILVFVVLKYLFVYEQKRLIYLVHDY